MSSKSIQPIILLPKPNIENFLAEFDAPFEYVTHKCEELVPKQPTSCKKNIVYVTTQITANEIIST